MNAVWLRLLYIFEFLIAIPAVYTLWSQVGGQGHMDLMPWFWKLGLGGSAAWAVVRVTKAAVEHERGWNLRSLSWLLLVLAIATLMGGVTYYYHLHETPGEIDSEETTTAAQHLTWARLFA
jgi:hypothetical protein